MRPFTDTEDTPQATWQTRRLDRVLGVVRLDELPVAVRAEGHIERHVVGVASAVQLDGHQRLLGAWSADPRCHLASMWDRALGEMRARGAQDAFVASCSDRHWQPAATQAAWPRAFVDTTVVPVLRSAVGLATWKDRRPMLRMLRDVITAEDQPAVEAHVDALEAAWGDQYPALVARCRDHADGLRALVALDTALRRFMAADSGITHFEYNLRRVARTTEIASGPAAVTELVMAAGVDPNGELTASTPGWNRALNALAATHPDRLSEIA